MDFEISTLITSYEGRDEIYFMRPGDLVEVYDYTNGGTDWYTAPRVYDATFLAVKEGVEISEWAQTKPPRDCRFARANEVKHPDGCRTFCANGGTFSAVCCLLGGMPDELSRGFICQAIAEFHDDIRIVGAHFRLSKVDESERTDEQRAKKVGKWRYHGLGFIQFKEAWMADLVVQTWNVFRGTRVVTLERGFHEFNLDVLCKNVRGMKTKTSPLGWGLPRIDLNGDFGIFANEDGDWWEPSWNIRG